MYRITRFEAIRGLVALFVAVSHVSEMSGNHWFIWSLAPLGVMVFFILSGFVINLSYQASSDKSFTYYLAKRVVRIYIPLIIVFVFSYLFLLPQLGDALSYSWTNILSNMAMLQGLFTAPLLENHPLWSLSYEWWYYMLFIPLITIFKGQRASILIYASGLTVSVLVSVTHILPFTPLSLFPIYLMVWWFGVDLSNAYMKNEGKLFFKDLLHPLIVLFISGAFLAYYHASFLILYTVITVLLGFAWYKAKWIFFDKTIGLFSFFGPMSYVIYISHWPLACQPNFLDFIAFKPLRYAIYLLGCIIFSYIVEEKLYPRIRAFVMPKLFPSKYKSE